LILRQTVRCLNGVRWQNGRVGRLGEYGKRVFRAGRGGDFFPFRHVKHLFLHQQAVSKKSAAGVQLELVLR
jgi:hypothetical protein